MAPGTIAQYSKLIDPAVRKHFIDRYKQLEPKLEMVYGRVEDARDYNEQESLYSGMGSVAAVAEGEAYTKDAPLQTYSTAYTQVKYGKIGELAYEVKLFEKDNLVSKMPKMLAQSAARKVETDAASPFNNGFNTAYTSYGDGKPFFSTDHTQAGGGTAQVNASTAGITLTEDNVETMQILLENILDDRGERIDIYTDMLLVPLQLRKEALIIAKSEYRSNTADNDVNVYNGGMLEYKGANIDKVVCWKYLTSSTAWFLGSKDNMLTWKWAEKTKLERDDSSGFETDMMKWKVRSFYDYGWSDYRGWAGSKGDGAAYSS